MTTRQPRELKLAVSARRFFSSFKIDQRTGCYNWVGCLNRHGYGQVRASLLSKEKSLAHRIMWDVVVGSIPPGSSVLHRCDNPRCVNVAHLFLGSKADNTHDMMRKGRHRSQRPGKYMPSGKAHPMYLKGIKLTRAKAIKIRVARGTYPEIAAKFGIDRSMVSKIKCGHHWK